MLNEFSLEVNEGERETLVKVFGDVDLDTADQLTAALKKCCRAGVERVVVDLHHVTYIDSAGLVAFHVANRAMHTHGGSLMVVGCSDRLLRIFRILKLDHLLAEPRPL